jgi:hypothetical protein
MPGIGQVAAKPFGDGFAFSTKFILTNFERAIVYFVAVGRAFDPTFVASNRSVLQSYLDRLQFAFDTAIRGAHSPELDTDPGIVTLRPPTKDEVLGPTVVDELTGQERFIPFAGFCDGPWARAGNPVPESIAPNPDFFQMYGAVDRYAGFFAVGNYPGIPAPEAAPAPDDFYPRFLAIHGIRTLDAWKQVYLGLGLDDLLGSIDVLRTLLSLPPEREFATPSGRWWSVRELDQALGDVFPDPTPPLGGPTLGGVVGRLARLAGRSTERPLSWRDTLNALRIPIELQGPPQGG